MIALLFVFPDCCLRQELLHIGKERFLLDFEKYCEVSDIIPTTVMCVYYAACVMHRWRHLFNEESFSRLSVDVSIC